MKTFVISLILSLFVFDGFTQSISLRDSAGLILSQTEDRVEAMRGLMALAQGALVTIPDSSEWLYGRTIGEIDQLVLSKGLIPERRRELLEIKAAAFNNMGANAVWIGQIAQALKNHYMSLSIREEIGDSAGIAGSLNNIAIIHHYYLKDYNHALSNYQRSLSLMKSMGNRDGEAVILHNIGGIYKIARNYPEALKYLFRSLQLRREIESAQGVSDAYNIISSTYKEMGDLKNAQDYAQKALEIRRDLGDHFGIGYSALNMGEIHYELGNHESSRHFASEAFDISREGNYPDLIMKTSLLLKKLYRDEGNFRKALEMSEIHLALHDSISRQENVFVAIRQEIGYEYDKKRIADSLTLANEKREHFLMLDRDKIRLENQRKLSGVVMVASVLGLVVVYLYFNRNRLRLMSKQRELQINALDTERRLLRTQMNPHFIFNSLNSIQSFILENDSKSARFYLQKFSKMVRAILEQSQRETVSISEEIELLELYLDLEQVRLNNRLTYTIECSEGMAVHSVRIPPLLIQPFVENSILHGLRLKEGQRTIRINFKVDNGMVRASIEDNGIGREKSREVNSELSNRKSSMAIELVRRRLDMMSVSADFRRSIVYTDLTDDQRISLGTRVELAIPYTL